MQKENEGVPEFSNIFHEKTWSLGIKVDRETKKSTAMKAVKEHVNKKKSSYEGQKNGDEGQNDAQVLKTYNSDTMTQNMGWKIISTAY